MLRYALLRLLGAIPTLLLVIVLAFLMVHAAPGGPFDHEAVLSADIKRNLEERYNLDAPLHEQLSIYLAGLLRGDLGPSFTKPGQMVAERIGDALPLSLRLGALAMLVAVVLGVSAGTVAALRKDSMLDRVTMAFAMTGISIPIFVIAPVLMLLFAVYAGWLPAGWSGVEGGARYVLPVIALALPQIAYIARLTRVSMIEVLGSDFIRTARAQGLDTPAIIRYHALKPAMMPVLSYMGPAIAAILTGSVVVEQIFGIPGLGQVFIGSAINRDHTMVLGIVIVYATMFIGLNLVVDIFYGALDPRIRRR